MSVRTRCLPMHRASTLVKVNHMARRILTYRTEAAAQRAMKRLTAKYPVHPDCHVAVVQSTHWQFPFRYLIAVTGRDNRTAYWSAAR